MRRSEMADVEVGGTSLHELVLEGGGTLIDGDLAVDGEMLRGRVEAVAATLTARGFGAGDVLGLLAPNVPPWVGVALGAMRAGGAVTPISPAATDAEVAKQLADAGARIAVTIEPWAGRIGGVDVLTIGPELLGGVGPAPAVTVDEHSTALLPYSSGTTGLPKGVVLTHANLVTSVRQIEACIAYEPGDTVLAVAPFAHIMGFVVTMATPLAHGATVVTVPRFDPAAFLALIERHRPTHLLVPPPVMPVVAAAQVDLSSVRVVVSGGAALPPAVQRAMEERLPHAMVGQAWGMTETSVGITGPELRRGTRPGSVGRLVPNTELRVVDPDTGADRGPGEDGELWARGPQVMAGYLGRPAETAEVLDADGWLRTGDLGHVTPDGDVVIVDRLKELIKVNAFQVAPAELEALLREHAAVADAAVVGRPDERCGELPVAFVVLRGEATEAALQAFVAERVAPYKRLAAVRFCEAIPRTPSGKILRRMLREQAAPVAA